MATWLLAERFSAGRVTSLGGASGAIAGLAAVTPGAGFVNPLGAVVIGALAGVICLYATQLKYVFRYDDALDVVGVHLVGGVLGTVLVGVFADRSVNPLVRAGLFYGGGLHLLGLQVLAVGVVFAFAFVGSFLIAKVIAITIGLRVSAKEEDDGLDISELLEMAYNPPHFVQEEDEEH